MSAPHSICQAGSMTARGGLGEHYPPPGRSRRDDIVFPCNTLSKTSQFYQDVMHEGLEDPPYHAEDMMKDATTGESLTVLSDGIDGPYMFVPVDQMEKVTVLLKENEIAHWVEDEVISIDGDPEDAVINFGRGSDPAKIQRILDKIL